MRILLTSVIEIGVDVLGYFEPFSLALWLTILTLRVGFTLKSFIQYRLSCRKRDADVKTIEGSNSNSSESHERERNLYVE